jgi:hypothetical protein
MQVLRGPESFEEIRRGFDFVNGRRSILLSPVEIVDDKNPFSVSLPRRLMDLLLMLGVFYKYAMCGYVWTSSVFCLKSDFGARAMSERKRCRCSPACLKWLAKSTRNEHYRKADPDTMQDSDYGSESDSSEGTCYRDILCDLSERQRTLDANPGDPQKHHPQPPGAPPVTDDAFINDQDAVDSTADDDDEEEKPKSDKKAGRRKIKIEFIQDKSRLHISFSRKAGMYFRSLPFSFLPHSLSLQELGKLSVYFPSLSTAFS